MKTIFNIAIALLIFSTTGLSQNIGTSVGQIAPEISMTSPDGKTMKLSDLRGKVVLIDFWASWCAPCRRENPTVVSAYNQFKNKKFTNGQGFEIYGVSLDKNQEAWKNAIATDKLNWANHVSDLKGWYSAAGRLYGINSIPANFLIDKDGKILAKNLRGEQLIAMLNSLVIQ